MRDINLTMRSEREMLDLILDTAREDERIRAVILSGSRANPTAPRDIFQDYDIVYVVTELDSFLNNPEWIDRFGERMILQTPEAMVDPPPERHGGFAYLMQFMDGNRIDLSLFTLVDYRRLQSDSLSVLLLDKDQHLGPLPPASDRDYLPKPPSAKAFSDCCNEFWWVCPYVAKGLWRDEVIYAKAIVDEAIRPQLMIMLDWYVGFQTGFSRSLGKHGKYLRQTLPPARWEALLNTYADAGIQNTWDALFVMCDLFRQTSQEVADVFGFDYPVADDQRVSAHLRHVRTLAGDAGSIY